MAASMVANVQLRVSSVLNRDVKQFGKKHLVDGEDDTCWNSDQGSPQWILVEFPDVKQIQEVQIQFQGGFAGKDCWIEGGRAIDNLTRITDIYPDDINSLQVFKLPENTVAKVMKIVFSGSTDFYGRITIYKLDVIGINS